MSENANVRNQIVTTGSGNGLLSIQHQVTAGTNDEKIIE